MSSTDFGKIRGGAERFENIDGFVQGEGRGVRANLLIWDGPTLCSSPETGRRARLDRACSAMRFRLRICLRFARKTASEEDCSRSGEMFEAPPFQQILFH